jgi:4-hydroxybenzoate polyprenyltransferase
LPHNVNLYWFVFFSTICSYNFYWLLSKFYFSKENFGIAFLKKHLSFLYIFLISAAGTFYFLLYVQQLLPYIFISIFLTLLYSLPLWPFAALKKLQRLGFFKTILLSIAWAYITTVLPAALIVAENILPVLLLFAARFCFMLLLCIIFDRRDISIDKLHGLRSLATDLPRQKLNIIINIVFVLYFAMGLLLRFHFNDKSQMFAFLITGAIVCLVYSLSLKKRGYLFYYFLVDGLMLVSALGTFIATLF